MFNKIRAQSLAGGEYIRREQIFSLQHETIYQLIYVHRLQEARLSALMYTEGVTS